MSKIAILSDSHDNLPNLHKFIEYCAENKISMALHCGDITSLSTWNYLQDNFKGEVHAVGGNADMIKLPRKKIIDINGIKIGLVHHPLAAKRLIEKENDLGFIFYGHSHKPWIEKIANMYLANPGTLAGMFYKATFAVLNTKTKKLNLILLDQI
ncbi:MAG: metallophosphoesterase family protein [Patescibacteria group bacterium]